MMGEEKIMRKVTWSPFALSHMLSYGIVAHCPTRDSWLLVQRHYSTEFTLLTRGSYVTVDLHSLLDALTREEAAALLFVCDMEPSANVKKFYAFKELLRKVTGDVGELSLSYAWKRFQKAEKQIKTVLTQRTTERRQGGGAEWLFPKGRMEGGEDGFECAQREFFEETGENLRQLPGCRLFATLSPLVEIFRGANGRVFETRMWIYLFKDEVKLKPVSAAELEKGGCEIGQRGWFSTQQALPMLSPSKRNLIMETKRLLKTREY